MQSRKYFTEFCVQSSFNERFVLHFQNTKGAIEKTYSTIALQKVCEIHCTVVEYDFQYHMIT